MPTIVTPDQVYDPSTLHAVVVRGETRHRGLQHGDAIEIAMGITADELIPMDQVQVTLERDAPAGGEDALRRQGGPRSGAGRPATGQAPKVSMSVRVAPDVPALLDAWAVASGHTKGSGKPNRSAAVEALVRSAAK